jgi:quercetin dioxygenase-like cupin family protein
MSNSTGPTIIPIESHHLPGGSTRFEGGAHDATTSFFVVKAPTGRGAARHRHPYPEIFVILDGEIEVKVNETPGTVGAGNIVIIPAGSWHEFKTISDTPARMVNIHPVAEMIQEDWKDLGQE